MIAAERRLPEAPDLVEQLGYFVVHAPRQTGKTTALIALAANLTASGRYAALLFSCEDGEPWGEDIGSAQRAILGSFKRALGPTCQQSSNRRRSIPEQDEGLLSRVLGAWARACPRPIVLLMDDI